MNQKQDLHIIHLARWYPNRFDSMLGLFIKRHVEAVAEYAWSSALYIHPTQNTSKKYEIDVQEEKQLLEVRVYYKNIQSNFPLISSLRKAIRFYKACFMGLKTIENQRGKADVIHVHILTRLGLLALWKKISNKTPYLITEHWSRYLPTGDFSGLFRKIFSRIIVKNASAVSTVTKNLQKAMESHRLFNSNYFTLPNIVSDSFFKTYKTIPSQKKIILHVSTFEDKSKNISGIIRTLGKLSNSRNDFLFKFIGDGQDFESLNRLAEKEISNPDCYAFTGLLEGDQLAQEFANADLMLIFSNYENLPVVLLEALSMGIPCLSTDVGGISEIIDSKNGQLIPAGDEEILHQHLVDFLDNTVSFNKSLIKEKYQKEFSKEVIGKLLISHYQKALNP